MSRYCVQLGHISERNRAEIALKAALREAEQSAEVARMAMLAAEAGNRAKTEFLANTGHELRTPLNAIIGFSSMLMRGMVKPEDSERFHDYAKDIFESGQQLLGVVNDILQLAKIEAGQLDLREDVIDIAECLTACFEKASQDGDRQGLVMHYAAPRQMPPVWADETKFRQIIFHLLSNAVKFTEKGGSVTLEADVDLAKGITVTVTDTGIGIARDNIWKALAAFSQVDGSLDRPHGGSGLGLPLSKALAELHDGTLELDSELDVGTTATLWLPVDRLNIPESVNPLKSKVV